MAYQQFLGRFEVTSSNDSLSLVNGTGTFAITLTNGFRFIRGKTSESTNQLTEDLTAKSIAADASLVGTTWVYDSSTGKVTATFPTNTAITWTDTGLQTLLGFTGTQSGASAYTGTKQARYTWRPTRSLSVHPGTLQTAWGTRSTTRVIRSKDGTISTVVGNKLYESPLQWKLLPEADVITPSTGTVYRDFENFWKDVSAEGEILRYQPDRSDYAATAVHSGVIAPSGDEEELGLLEDSMERAFTSYNGLWGVSLVLYKVPTE